MMYWSQRMSTSPEIHLARAEDEIVTVLSQWLAYHLSNGELRQRLLDIGTADLAEDPRDAVAELLDELEEAAPGERGDLEMLARETLEVVALG